MKIDCIIVGPIQCNCYVLSDPVSRKAYLIDPGAESDELISFLRRTRLELQAVLITHAHIDHIGGIEMVRKEFSAPVHFHAGDQLLYDNIAMQAQFFGMRPSDLQSSQPKPADGSLTDGQQFESIRVIHTPGHTPGSVCFHAMDLVFTGDTLFQGSIGRTDLWGGSYEQIIDSIRSRLLTLPDNVQVFPGHNEPTTIGDERHSNPFLV